MTTGHDPHVPARADDRPWRGRHARPDSVPPAPREGSGAHRADRRVPASDSPTALLPAAPRPPAPRPAMPDAPLGSPIGYRPPPPKARRRFPVGAALGIAGAGLVAVGVVLPWVTVAGALPITGLVGDDGRIALGAGGALLLAAALRFQPRAGLLLRIVAGLAGLAAAGVAALDLTSLGRLTGDVAALVQTGPGLPLLAAGGVVGLLSAFLRGRAT